MRTYSYSVILATYKERRNLAILLPKLINLMDKRGQKYEVLIVDDGSEDGSKELIAKINRHHKRLRLIDNKKKIGLAHALVKGTKFAKYANIARMDADLAHRPKDLIKLLNKYEKMDGKAVIIGSRFSNNSRYKGKHFLNKFFSFCGRLLNIVFFNIEVRDSSNNFRVFPKKNWVDNYQHYHVKGNVFLVLELILLKKTGLNLLELGIYYSERKYGASKLNLLQESLNYLKSFPVLFQHAK